MLTLDERSFIDATIRIVSMVSDDISEDNSKPNLGYNIAVLEQCYLRAQATTAIFQCDDGINYYREAGLYCYWLRKLKPFFVRREAVLKVARSNINEIIAYYVAVSVIEIAHKDAFNKLEQRSDEKLSENKECLLKNYKKAHRLEDRIINSLRYHVYSAGSIPTMLEASFGLPLDDEFAYDLS